MTQNKEILLKLLATTTQEEVTELIHSHPFFKRCTWVPYGNQENNAGTIKAQSPDPVGALVEKITNGIDALLTRMCWDKQIDPTSPSAPQSQGEAIRNFFGSKTADFNLLDKEVREIASKTVRIIGEGTVDKPTISIVDFGEGQHPKDFPKTFFSLGGSNKIKIKFAHGVYNQGGSAALKFCGNGYQLVLSRRAPNLNSGEPDLWGFSLVRERYEQGFKAEWYEYCVVDDEIPSFPYESLKVLPDGEALESGSFIRLYSYSLKNPNFFITGQRDRELAREITISAIFQCHSLSNSMNYARNYVDGQKKIKLREFMDFGGCLKSSLMRKKSLKKYYLSKQSLAFLG